MDQERIRNFCIVAHIDHGKSTLADRILELTGAVSKERMREQFLDAMDLERERGITIKMTAITLPYHADDGKEYTLNLIDTPGHVDFSYEVSRSLAACEGAILVVDAAQGVEAQTLANVNLAMANNLTIVPVINKIDLERADPDAVKQEIEETLMLDASDAVLASARLGIGTEEVLRAVVDRVPPPSGDPEAPLRALIFDSHYDQFQGVVPYIRIVDGFIRRGDLVKMMSSGREFEVHEVGVFVPEMRPKEELRAGEVGYLIAGIRDVHHSQVGDTITQAERPAQLRLPGYRTAKPMVFCGLYPIDSNDYHNLRDALAKLQLNDAALSYEPETSAALAFGFRCGFLGLLHMEIVQERLDREFKLNVIATAPSVIYRVTTTAGRTFEIDNPKKLPAPTELESIEEPIVDAIIVTPSDYVGPLLELAEKRRGDFRDMEYSGPQHVILRYDLPLAEILMDFFNQLKARSRGYASLDYEFSGFRESRLQKVDVMINKDPVDALSFITHKDHVEARSRNLVTRMKEVIPRQLFEVRIQAAIGSKIVASERIRPLRKDVIAKCYGGDVTRKRKLLEKQKAGKKRMKQIGSVELPQEAFMSVLKMGEG
jgi:GTP-binding protein LepA